MVWSSLVETLLMVGLSTALSLVLGGGLGVLLSVTSPAGLKPHALCYGVLSFFVNAIRSIPYIILTVFIIPLTRILVGTSIGTLAAVIPLTVAGLLLIARNVEDSFRSIPQGLIEVGLSCGATRGQIIRKILLSEALPSLVSSTTLVVINIIGFSAMAGAVGGGGLGDLAIRYGYQRYDLTLLLLVVVILIGLVHLVQSMGDFLVKRLKKN